MNEPVRTLLVRFNPAVNRRYLFLLSGGLWSIAGFILCTRAAGWLDDPGMGIGLVTGLSGIVIAIPVYAYFFSKLVRKNIYRITALPDRVCLFAFTPWRGYLIIAVMIGIGTLARDSSLPRAYLMVPYTAMGGTLLIGSTRFFREFFHR